MTERSGTNNIISSTTYGPASELTAMSGTWGKQGQTEISQITQTCMGDEMAAGVDGNERDIGIGVAEL